MHARNVCSLHALMNQDRLHLLGFLHKWVLAVPCAVAEAQLLIVMASMWQDK